MTYLVDTSAWHRLSKPALAGRRASLIADDSVSICELVALKVLFSARSADDYDRTARNISGFRMAPTRPTEFERARDVQHRLAHQGGLHHRSVTIADLIIAATAESAGLTVLHYDEDYDRIAAVTGQPTEWLAARGTL